MMDPINVSHNEEYYTATLILLLLALKHREDVAKGCSIPIFDWEEGGRIEMGRLEQILTGVDRFDVFGGPSREIFKSEYWFDPDIIVAGPHLLMLIEVKSSTEGRVNRVEEYLKFVVDPEHRQSKRWLLLVLPHGWWKGGRKKFWEDLKNQAADRAKIGWVALEDVVKAIREKVPHVGKLPHEGGLRWYPGSAL